MHFGNKKCEEDPQREKIVLICDYTTKILHFGVILIGATRG